MKKRLVALLLVLIMVLGLLPVSAFAADMSWTWTVTIFGGNYCRSDGTESSTNKYTVNRHLDNSKDNDIGYQFEWNANAGGSTYKGGWQLCMTVNGSVVERTSAYIYSKDMSTASDSWTAPGSSHTGNSSHPFTLYLSDYPNANYRYDETYTLNYYKNTENTVTNMPEPNPQTEKSNTGKVTFKVSSNRPVRDGYNFVGWNGNPSATEATVKPGNEIMTPAKVTNLYAIWECNHPKDDDGNCTTPGCTHPDGCCPKPEDPNPGTDWPRDPDNRDGDALVTVDCVGKADHDSVSYGLIAGRYSVTDKAYNEETNTYTYTVEVIAAGYVSDYNTSVGVEHTLKDEDDEKLTFTMTWDKENEKWNGTGVTFEVECETEEEKPGKPDMSKFLGNVLIRCTTDGSTHAKKGKKDVYSNTKDPDTYTEVLENGEAVWQDDDGVWTYQIKLNRAKIVDAYSKNPLINRRHIDTTPDVDTYLTWKYNNGAWELIKLPGYTEVAAIIEVVCGVVPEPTEELFKNEILPVVCEAYDTHNDTLKFSDGEYHVHWTKGAAECYVTFGNSSYVKKYNEKHPEQTHTLVRMDTPVKYVYNENTGKWELDEVNYPNKLGLYVTCVPEFTKDYVAEEELRVICNSVASHNDTLKFKDGTYNIHEEAHDKLRKFVTFETRTYVEKYNEKHPDKVHTPVGEIYRVEYDFNPETGKWERAQGEEQATLYVSCVPDAPTADEVKAALGNVTVKCVNPTTGANDCTDVVYGAAGGNSVGEAVKVTDTQYTVSIGADAFVNAYAKGKGAHDRYSAASLTWVLNYSYEESKWVGTPANVGVDDTILVTHAPKKWQEVGKISGKDVGIKATCTTGTLGPITYGLTAAFVYYDTDVISVDYQGEGRYLATFKTDKYYTTGNGIDRSCNDVHKDTRTHKLTSGNETVQWYFTYDGAWSATPKTAGTDDTITVVHDFVVTFDPANGEKTFTQNVFDGEKATKPADPTRNGYNFEYWYLDDENTAYDFNKPVTGNITLTAKWSIASHNIYAYARVITSFGPLTKVEFHEDPNFKLSKADQSSFGLGEYNDNGYFSIGTFAFDEEPLTEDLYFNDATTAKVAAALATKIHLETGVTQATANKIAWTYLYEADDSEDSDFMYKSGYPTDDEDGYQLSGNLYLTSVMYNANADGDEVTGIPEAKYTYDDSIDINDFYFPGTTIELPTPKRLGYIFKGWSVEVTAGENEKDADCYDMTGADDGEADVEEKLYKGGDSYPIGETDGVLKFTAQWEKVTIPTDEELKDLEYVVLVKCIADETQSHMRAYSLLGELNEDYFINTLTIDKDNGEVRFDISIWPDLYVAAFNKELPNHVRTDTKLVPITMVWDDTDECWLVKTQGRIEVTEEHTVTFVPDNGDAETTERVIHGEKVAQPNPAPEKVGFTFKGWYLGDAEYDFNTPVTSDITLTAKWERNNYSYLIEYYKQVDTKDGSVAYVLAETETVPSVPFGSTVTINLADAKYQNRYVAEHYFVDAANVNNVLTGVVGADNKTPVLKVYYNLDFHTLTFDTMGGSKVAPETVRHGLAAAKPADPVNAGYVFQGWYTDKTFRYRYNFATPLTEDITVYAKWVWIVLPGTTVKKNTPKLNTADHFAYVQGYPDGTVKPTGNITRAETAAILFRLMDDSTRNTYYSTRSGFRDVALGSWYNTYVATLNNAGVITDSANGYFRPNEAITRAELAAMLANFTETTGAANYFNDVSAKYWAANAIAICAKLGWITGYPDGSFRPDRNVTRAELMAMINRATGRAPKSADAFLSGMKTWKDNTADKWYYLDVQEATNSHSYTVKNSEIWTALNADPNWSKYE